MGKLQELFIVRCAAGDVIFFNTVGAHNAPLVVVAAQPQLGDVGETPILPNILGIDVAVIVADGHFCCVVMIQPLGGLVGQQEVLIHKFLHFHALLFSNIYARFF